MKTTWGKKVVFKTLKKIDHYLVEHQLKVRSDELFKTQKYTKVHKDIL